MRELFGAIAADRHAAPSSRPPARVVGEHQRAAMSLARLHIGEIFLAHEFRQCFGDRRQKRFGGAPAPRHPQFQAIAIVMAMPRYFVERLVAFQESVERFQFTQHFRRQRPPDMPDDKASKPFAQSASLFDDWCAAVSGATGWRCGM